MKKYHPFFPLLLGLVISPTVLLSQEKELVIQNYISQYKLKEYKKPGLADFTIVTIDFSKSMHGDIIKIQQRYRGVPIRNSEGRALIKNNKIAYYWDNFVKNYNTPPKTQVIITDKEALKKIADYLEKPEISEFKIIESSARIRKKTKLAAKKLVYAKNKDESLSLAYEYTLHDFDSPNFWNILVDATSGEILSKRDLIMSCSFYLDAYAHGNLETISNSELFITPYAKPRQKTKAVFPLSASDNTAYNVLALPTEAPTFGSRAVISNPWLPESSPEGWHSDGINIYSYSRGNNVYAYEFIPGTITPGFSPDGGSFHNFDFPFSMTGTPIYNQSAAITNLFYITNKLHDVFYHLGFTESAGNFQQNNFNKGGEENDSLLAQARLAHYNNASFIPQPDGTSPIINVGLWTLDFPEEGDPTPIEGEPRDGSFDNGTTIHEYAHGVTSRLAGLDDIVENAEQLREGWADFFSIMLTSKPGDNASIPRTQGTYSIGQPMTGPGTRIGKYSPDFSINSYTYGDTSNMWTPNPGYPYPDIYGMGFV